MSKELFIEEINKLIEQNLLSSEAVEYFNSNVVQGQKKGLTEKGKSVLSAFKNLGEGSYKGKVLAEQLGWSSRSISGVLTSLCKSGHLTKEKDAGEGVFVYTITQLGLDENID